MIKVFLAGLTLLLISCGAPTDNKKPNQSESASDSLVQKEEDPVPNDSVMLDGKMVRMVEVDNVNDLYSAIASNTYITLANGDYHLNQVDSSLSNPHCNWAMVLFDEIMRDERGEEDKTLLINGVKNLTIHAADSADSVQILTNRRSASVLAFENCKKITLEGITLGHYDLKYTGRGNDRWASYCSGEVLEFFDSKNIAIDNCVLFGCGTRGFLAHRCKDFSISNSEIKECSYGAFGVFDSEDIAITGVDIHHNNYTILYEIDRCKNLKVTDSKAHHNRFAPGAEAVKRETDSENIDIGTITKGHFIIIDDSEEEIDEVPVFIDN